MEIILCDARGGDIKMRKDRSLNFPKKDLLEEFSKRDAEREREREWRQLNKTWRRAMRRS